METLLNVIGGLVLLYAALDRLNSMSQQTRFAVRLAGWLLALAGLAGVMSMFTTIHMLPTLAIAGSAAWLVADRRGTR